MAIAQDYLKNGRSCSCQQELERDEKNSVEGVLGLDQDEDSDDELDGDELRQEYEEFPALEQQPMSLRRAVCDSLLTQKELLRSPEVRFALQSASDTDEDEDEDGEQKVEEGSAAAMRRSASMPSVTCNDEEYFMGRKMFSPSKRVRSYGSLSGAPLDSNVIICESKSTESNTALRKSLVSGVSAIVFSGAAMAVGVYSLAKWITSTRRFRLL